MPTLPWSLHSHPAGRGGAGRSSSRSAVLPTAIALPGTLAIAALPWILRSHPGAPSWLRAISAGVEEAERLTFNRRASWRPLAAVGYLAFGIAVLWWRSACSDARQASRRWRWPTASATRRTRCRSPEGSACSTPA